MAVKGGTQYNAMLGGRFLQARFAVRFVATESGTPLATLQDAIFVNASELARRRQSLSRFIKSRADDWAMIAKSLDEGGWVWSPLGDRAEVNPVEVAKSIEQGEELLSQYLVAAKQLGVVEDVEG
jgi:hypothetical protein